MSKVILGFVLLSLHVVSFFFVPLLSRALGFVVSVLVNILHRSILKTFGTPSVISQMIYLSC